MGQSYCKSRKGEMESSPPLNLHRRRRSSTFSICYSRCLTQGNSRRWWLFSPARLCFPSRCVNMPSLRNGWTMQAFEGNKGTSVCLACKQTQSIWKLTCKPWSICIYFGDCIWSWKIVKKSADVSLTSAIWCTFTWVWGLVGILRQLNSTTWQNALKG